jgi:hypothetical protein
LGKRAKICKAAAGEDFFCLSEQNLGRASRRSVCALPRAAKQSRTPSLDREREACWRIIAIRYIHPAMPSRTALSTPLRAWNCASCCQRTFTTSAARAAVGPEHPRYIDFPEPPQQTSRQTKWMKGVLPIPRNVFAGKGAKDLSNEEVLSKTTKTAQRHSDVERGSREAWKIKMAERAISGRVCKNSRPGN